MTIPRQIILNLVAGDNAPDLEIRFVDLDLSDYTSIVMHVKRDDEVRFSRTVTPDGTVAELGTVQWSNGDLVEGRHEAEFEFTNAGTGRHFTLPIKYPVILAVRGQIG